jgi:tRNA dimethylallyltransferase
VPHHLIDIIDPADSYSAASSRGHAAADRRDRRARQHAAARRRHDAVLQGADAGLNDLPGADPALRAELDADAARDGWPALHARLARIDPATAARLAPNDAQRIQRALEVCMLSGQPMSALLAAPRAADDAAAAYRFVPVALEPSDRAVLHARIAQRFDAMLEAGFIDEVERLRRREDLHLGLPSMRCVGYRQAWEYLDGAIDYRTMRDKGIFATRQLCKRQITWLRAMPERIVVDCIARDSTAQALDALERVLDGLAAR